MCRLRTLGCVLLSWPDPLGLAVRTESGIAHLVGRGCTDGAPALVHIAETAVGAVILAGTSLALESCVTTTLRRWCGLAAIVAGFHVGTPQLIAQEPTPLRASADLRVAVEVIRRCTITKAVAGGAPSEPPVALSCVKGTTPPRLATSSSDHRRMFGATINF